jgi:hypothetical protein
MVDSVWVEKAVDLVVAKDPLSNTLSYESINGLIHS